EIEEFNIRNQPQIICAKYPFPPALKGKVF
ncbi:MAG: hypothetical protein ACI9Y7_002058, partial [Dokdonia sp.]